MAKTIPIQLSQKQIESTEHCLEMVGEFLEDWAASLNEDSTADERDLAEFNASHQHYLDACEAFSLTPVEIEVDTP